MATNAPKKTAKKKPAPPQYNGWDVLVKLIDGIFGLFNSNKIYPAFIFLLFLLAGLIVWRLPGMELAAIVKLLIEQLATSRGILLGLLLASNASWYFLYRRRVKLDLNEIERMSAVRSELMHGGLPIKDHRSSEGPSNETYIFPSKEPATKNGTAKQ